VAQKLDDCSPKTLSNISQGIVYSDAPSSAELQRITSSFLNWLARCKLAGKHLVTMFLTCNGQFLSYFAAQFSGSIFVEDTIKYCQRELFVFVNGKRRNVVGDAQWLFHVGGGSKGLSNCS